MKKILLISILTLNISQAFSQSQNGDQLLPDNPRFVKGVLENGLTYYIYPTQSVKNAASYYIISNAGSILEEDNQSGLAHFLEHMAFNGTKNFPDKGILNTLQRHGAVFGKDINATTLFDETIYHMDNIPTNEQMVDTCLMILHDWANEITLDDDEIDKERGVILEEWRTNQNGRMRLLVASLPTLFINTKYAKRIPIGSTDVIKNFKHEALRKFYHDWYRTDLQAIAIIGDVDAKEVENKIKKIFSGIPALKNPKERTLITIPENQKMLYFMGMDKEVSTSAIQFNIHSHKLLRKQTVNDLKDNLVEGMIFSMFNARIEELMQKPDAPFSYAVLNMGDLSRTERNMTLLLTPKPDKQYESFKLLMREFNRAVKFGFTQSEIDRAIATNKNMYEQRISTLEDMPHLVFAMAIQKNYLENLTITDPATEYEVAKKIFAELAPDDFKQHLNKLYTQKNRTLIVTGVAGEKNLQEADALKIINDAENDTTLTPYKDEFSGKSLISGIEIQPGKIRSEKNIEAIGATLFELSNGIKVYYKFTDKDKDKVLLMADSDGGLSLVSDDDLPAAEVTTTLADLSGLNEYNATQLSKILAGKTAGNAIKINEINEVIMGSSSTKDTETLLQLALLRFIKPRFDEKSLEVVKQNLENEMLENSKNVQARISDSILVAVFGKNNPRKRLLDKQYIDDITFDKVKEVYHQRFGDPGDFTFFIAGDIKKEALKPLLEKYIAGMPVGKTKEHWKDNYIPWLSDQIKKDIFLPMETPKNIVQIRYEKDLEWSLKNQYLLRTLSDILQLRYNTTLREDEGGTYGALVYNNFDKRPREIGTLGVFFECNPKLTDKLLKITHEEMEKIKKGQINPIDLQKTLTNYIKEEEQAQEKNLFYIDQLYTYVKDGYNIADPKNTTDIIKSITEEDLKKFTKRFFKNVRQFELVFKPQ